MSELWEVLNEHFPEFSSGLWVTIRLVVAAFVIAMVGRDARSRRCGSRPSRWLNRHRRRSTSRRSATSPCWSSCSSPSRDFRRAGVPVGQWAAGIGCLGLYTAAYIAEALRSGVFSVGKGQIEAALSLGLPYPRTMRLIILPQACADGDPGARQPDASR